MIDHFSPLSGLSGNIWESQGCCYCFGKILPGTFFWLFACSGDTAYSLLFEQINSEREDSQIDKALLKNVLAVYVEMGMGKMDCNAKDYSGKFSLGKDSCIQDKLKVEFWQFDFPLQ